MSEPVKKKAQKVSRLGFFVDISSLLLHKIKGGAYYRTPFAVNLLAIETIVTI